MFLSRIGLAIATVLVLAGCGTSSAAPAGAPNSGPDTINVPLANRRLNLPTHLAAGANTFRFSTHDLQGHTVLLLRLPEGVTQAQWLEDLHATPPGTRYPTTENTGGALVVADTATTVTMVLTPGPYQLFDFFGQGVQDPTPAVRELTVFGDPRHARVPAPDSVIVHADVEGKPRFVVPDQLPAHGTFLVHNGSSGIEEAAFLPLRPDATAADLAAFFEAISKGQKPASSPFTGGAIGVPALTPGRIAVVHFDAQPGRYALASFVTNPATGNRRAAEGVLSIVTLV
jgi:hypothetical protein